MCPHFETDDNKCGLCSENEKKIAVTKIVVNISLMKEVSNDKQ